MKIVFLIFLLISSKIYSKDYIYEVGGTNSPNDANSIECPDGTKYIVYHGTNSAWKDNNGDYGNEKCIGNITVKKDKSAIAYFRCISVNQNGEKFWTTRERKSQIEEGGGGINTYTAATGKYKKMIGLKCPYGVQYHQDVVWYTHRCKLN